MNNVLAFPAVELIEIDVMLESTLNVATSVFGVEMLPGNVPSPVLQLFSPGTASHTPLVGAAFQFALAAYTEGRPTPVNAVQNPSIAILDLTVTRLSLVRTRVPMHFDQQLF